MTFGQKGVYDEMTFVKKDYMIKVLWQKGVYYEPTCDEQSYDKKALTMSCHMTIRLILQTVIWRKNSYDKTS